LEKITARLLNNLQSDGSTLGERLERLVEQVVTADEGQTIFIVGPTGSGKTTFVDRFFRKTLSDNLRARCVDVRVSCLDLGGSDENAAGWLTGILIQLFEAKLFEDGNPTFDDLKGMYFREYERRRRGTGSALYAADKAQFQVEFGRFLDTVVEQDREGYLKRLLADVVRNRGKLPVIVIDNIDESSIEQQTSIFQLSQSLRRFAKHALVVFPITDKTAWRFKRSDIFGIYRSKSFFLPTPSPRDVFSKRVEYLRNKVRAVGEKQEDGNYFLSRGIKVSINNLDGFASALEDIFIDQENTAKTLGELSNYNIRRTLELARRVMTSSVFAVDDLVASFISGRPISRNYDQTIAALMKGDYENYLPKDEHFIVPLFQVGATFRQSPLLAARVLAFFEATSERGRSVEERHASVDTVIQFFDSIGASESALLYCLDELMQARLIEPFDMTDTQVDSSQNLAITHAGRAHLQLATANRVCLEQMAITTAITSAPAATEIRKFHKNKDSQAVKYANIRKSFAEFLINEDAVHMSEIPSDPRFEHQIELVARIQSIGRLSNENSQKPNWVGRTGIVDRIEFDKNFGFADVAGISGRVFFHLETAKRGGFMDLAPGDDIVCDVEKREKGFAISRFHEVDNNPETFQTEICEVAKIFTDRGYGFATIEGEERDAYFHFKSLSTADLQLLTAESVFEAQLRKGDKQTFEVRRILRFM